MRPSHLQELHAKRETNGGGGGGGGLCPPPLKIHKDSHMVKKTSPSSSFSSSAASSLAGSPSKQPQRHPVIIYTHSPKVIHTHPKDFMALVQKLTGLSGHEDDNAATPPKAEQAKINNSNNNINNDDNESSSVITTDENNICGGSSDHHGNSSTCLVPPPPPPMIFDGSSSNYMNIPLFEANSSSTDYLCRNNQGGFYSYTDSLFFGGPNSNVRSSITSSSGLEGIDKLNEY